MKLSHQKINCQLPFATIYHSKCKTLPPQSSPFSWVLFRLLISSKNHSIITTILFFLIIRLVLWSHQSFTDGNCIYLRLNAEQTFVSFAGGLRQPKDILKLNVANEQWFGLLTTCTPLFTRPEPSRIENLDWKLARSTANLLSHLYIKIARRKSYTRKAKKSSISWPFSPPANTRRPFWPFQWFHAHLPNSSCLARLGNAFHFLLLFQVDGACRFWHHIYISTFQNMG